MPNADNDLYEFGSFRLDIADQRLFRDGKPLHLEKKALGVLVVLVQSEGRLVTRDELTEKVWGAGVYVDPNTVSTQVAAVRRTLGKKWADKYIQTEHGRGYRFTAEVRVVERTTARTLAGNGESEAKPDEPKPHSFSAFPTEQPPRSTEEMEQTDFVPVPVTPKKRIRTKRLLLIAISIVALVAVFTVGFYLWRQSEEETVKRTLLDSQLYETLEIYTNPNEFSKDWLKKYWVTEEQGGMEIKRVITAVEGLRNKGRRYGKDSKSENFEFRYVKLSWLGNQAEISTNESWYLPMYDKDGNRVTGRREYQTFLAIYFLEKRQGRWLIQRTTVPRPAPSPTVMPQSSLSPTP